MAAAPARELSPSWDLWTPEQVSSLPSNFSPFPAVDKVTDSKTGGCRLMARGEHWRGVRDLGTMSGHRCRPPERKVPRQAPGEGAQAAGQGAHGRGEAREASGSLGPRRGRRGLRVQGSRGPGLLRVCFGFPWTRGSRGRARLPSPFPLPSEVPVIEHLFAVWVQGPVIAFTCRGSKDRPSSESLVQCGGDFFHWPLQVSKALVPIPNRVLCTLG